MGTPSWADALAAVSTALTALLTFGIFVLAVVAWRTASQTLEESRKASLAAQKSAAAAEAANDQLRRDSAERTRPYVFVEVLPGLAGVPAWDLRIKNVGNSAARELVLSPRSWPARDDIVIQSLRELCDTPRTLPPGCSIRAVWRVGEVGPGQSTDGPSELGMEEQEIVSVSYRGSANDEQAFADEFDLMTHGSGLWPVPEDGPDAVGLRGDLRKFYLLGQALCRRVGELGR